jgi:hypothetical protein
MEGVDSVALTADGIAVVTASTIGAVGFLSTQRLNAIVNYDGTGMQVGGARGRGLLLAEGVRALLN